MPFSSHNADVLTLASVLLVSLMSGFISIAQRIARGAAVTTLWLVSEFAAALLLGYLMFDAYPRVQHLLPNWVTLPIAVAAAAHFGGRGLQAIEKLAIEKWPFLDRRCSTKDDE